MKFLENNPECLAERISDIAMYEETAIQNNSITGKSYKFSSFHDEAITKIAIILLDHQKIISFDKKFIEDLILKIKLKTDALTILRVISTIADCNREEDIKFFADLLYKLDANNDDIKLSFSNYSVINEIIISLTAESIAQESMGMGHSYSFSYLDGNNWERTFFDGFSSSSNRNRFFISEEKNPFAETENLSLAIPPETVIEKIGRKKKQLENTWFVSAQFFLRLKKLRKTSSVFMAALDILENHNSLNVPRYFIDYAGSRIHRLRKRVRTNTKYFRRYSEFLARNAWKAINNSDGNSTFLYSKPEEQKRGDPFLQVPITDFGKMDRTFIRILLTNSNELMRFVNHVNLYRGENSIQELFSVLDDYADCLISIRERQRAKKMIKGTFARIGYHIRYKEW